MSSSSNSMPTLCGIRMPEKVIHAALKLEKPLGNDSHPFGGNLAESNRFQGELANSQQQKDVSPCCESSHHPLVRVLSRSVVSHSLGPHGLYYPPGHLCASWNFPGKNIGVGCHFLLQRIFLTQGSDPGLPHRRQTLPSEPPGIYVQLNPFAIHLKLIQHCKSTII